MKRVALTVASLLLSVILVGCSRNQASPSSTDPGSEGRFSAAVSGLDPCGIVLTPQPGDQRLDRDISRWQARVRHASDPVPALERLGWAFVGKARTTFDPGYYKLAEQSALCIESKKPGTAELRLLRGHVLHSLHKFKESETLARELVATRGLSLDYALLGDVLMEQGRLTEATDAYQNMMDLKPSPQAYSRAAHLRWLRGDLGGAMELMDMVSGASDWGDAESAAWSAVRFALYALQAGDRKKALELAETALALQVDYAPALLARGRVLLAEGRMAEAIHSLQRAARLNPLPEYQWLESDALRAANRIEEAATVERGLMQRGAVDDPRTFAVFLATRGEDVEKALRLAQQEMDVRADIFTLDSAAWAFYAAGKTAEARALSERALKEGTEDARLFLHAGAIAAASGEAKEAGRWLEKAAAIEQMLFPSEREKLATLRASNPIFGHMSYPLTSMLLTDESKGDRK